MTKFDARQFWTWLWKLHVDMYTYVWLGLSHEPVTKLSKKYFKNVLWYVRAIFNQTISWTTNYEYFFLSKTIQTILDLGV